MHLRILYPLRISESILARGRNRTSNIRPFCAITGNTGWWRRLNAIRKCAKDTSRWKNPSLSSLLSVRWDNGLFLIPSPRSKKLSLTVTRPDFLFSSRHTLHDYSLSARYDIGYEAKPSLWSVHSSLGSFDRQHNGRDKICQGAGAGKSQVIGSNKDKKPKQKQTYRSKQTEANK